MFKFKTSLRISKSVSHSYVLFSIKSGFKTHNFIEKSMGFDVDIVKIYNISILRQLGSLFSISGEKHIVIIYVVSYYQSRVGNLTFSNQCTQCSTNANFHTNLLT